MAHFNFVISQNAKWGHAGFYIDCHRMTVPENILLRKKHWKYSCVRVETLTPGLFDGQQASVGRGVVVRSSTVGGVLPRDAAAGQSARPRHGPVLVVVPRRRDPPGVAGTSPRRRPAGGGVEHGGDGAGPARVEALAEGAGEHRQRPRLPAAPRRRRRLLRRVRRSSGVRLHAVDVTRRRHCICRVQARGKQFDVGPANAFHEVIHIMRSS